MTNTDDSVQVDSRSPQIGPHIFSKRRIREILESLAGRADFSMIVDHVHLSLLTVPDSGIPIDRRVCDTAAHWAAIHLTDPERSSTLYTIYSPIVRNIVVSTLGHHPEAEIEEVMNAAMNQLLLKWQEATGDNPSALARCIA